MQGSIAARHHISQEFVERGVFDSHALQKASKAARPALNSMATRFECPDRTAGPVSITAGLG